MAAAKERLDSVENTIDTMQDEIQTLTTKLHDMEASLQQMAGDNRRIADEQRTSMNQILTMLHRNQEDAAIAPREPRRHDHNPPTLARHVKLDLPRFNGDDPAEWATSRRLGTDAAVTPWLVFEEELWKRFGPSKGPHFHEALSKIHQTGSLRDYQREFEQLQYRVHNWSEEALVGTFLGGLNTTIAAQVRMFSRTTLQQVFDLARLSDEQLQAQKKAFTPPHYPSTPTSAIGSRGLLPTPTHRPLQPRDPQTPTPKRLSWDEMKRKQSLGLCFSCDERYAPGHECKTSQLLLMLGEDPEDEEDDEEFHEAVEPEITLHALSGWDSSKTIHVQAMINRQQLVALIDSGSTHNFINERAANKLNLKSTITKPFAVKVADGHPLHYRRVHRRVGMTLGELTFFVDLYALPLMGLDVILGIQWLETLGPTLCDWKAHTMQFNWAGQKHTLHGLTGPKIQQAPWVEVAKEARLGQTLFALSLTTDAATVRPEPEELRRLLHEFDLVFQTPSELPPTRDMEHHIVLKEGSDPVNVWPYRYAYFQKAEIEK
ncbi:unnamed protein product [Arabidopsis thaliana]|uniref:Retrotransposon gag domain-containing protein n=1 Tax=Arabidopsis thaliana TaxID=3702 RepID=A0A5S9WXI9_ARATH|nr:unnamed protein product [Arabidopsis thaliana]